MQTNLGEPAASKPLESPFIGYNSVHECVIVVEEGKILEKERVKMTFGEFSRSLNLMGLAHFNIFTWLQKKVGMLLFRPLSFTLRPPFMTKMPLKTDFAS
jgi:hypothetical protein